MSLGHIARVARRLQANDQHHLADVSPIMPRHELPADPIDRLIDELDWTEWEAECSASRYRPDEVPPPVVADDWDDDLAWDDSVDLSEAAIDAMYEQYLGDGFGVYRD